MTVILTKEKISHALQPVLQKENLLKIDYNNMINCSSLSLPLLFSFHFALVLFCFRVYAFYATRSILSPRKRKHNKGFFFYSLLLRKTTNTLFFFFFFCSAWKILLPLFYIKTKTERYEHFLVHEQSNIQGFERNVEI